MACQHLNFGANVNVGRVTDGDDGPVIYYLAEVTVKCVECQTAFHFVGLPTGYSPNGPHISWNGLELRAPISPGPILLDERAHTIQIDASKPTRENKN